MLRFYVRREECDSLGFCGTEARAVLYKVSDLSRLTSPFPVGSVLVVRAMRVTCKRSFWKIGEL